MGALLFRWRRRRDYPKQPFGCFAPTGFAAFAAGRLGDAGLVVGDVIRVERDGLRILETSVSGIGGTGIGKVGVYSNDNDGGVFYDNFCAWRLDE